MTDLYYIQPVFAPDAKRTERNINSIRSFGEYLKQNGTDNNNLTVVIGGWAKTDELWEQINRACKESFNESFNPIRFDRNYGKATVVNKLVAMAEQSKPSYDYILTADSDILFPIEQRNMFARLIIAAKQSETAKRQPFGLLSLNQLGAGCHWKVCYENGIAYEISMGEQLIKKSLFGRPFQAELLVVAYF